MSNNIMAERQSYQFFDSSIKGKILKRNSTEYGMYINTEVVDGVYDPNNIVGKFTGNYSVINRNYHWEIELFNHYWSSKGAVVFFTDFVTGINSDFSTFKYFEVLTDDGTVKGNVFKSHYSRTPMDGGSDLFPHFDPDYLLYSDPEKWDKYFHVLPTDWVWKTDVWTNYSYWSTFRPFYGYNHIPVKIRTAVARTDYPDKSTNTQRICGVFFPIFGGTRITDKGACVAAGYEPTIADIISPPPYQMDMDNYYPMLAKFSGLTAGTTYKLRSYVKYLDDNDEEQIQYSDSIEFTTPTTIVFPPNVLSGVAMFMDNESTYFNVAVWEIGDLGPIDEAGIVLALHNNPTVADLKFTTVNNIIDVPEQVYVTGLLAGTRYYVKAFVRNGSTITYSDVIGQTNTTYSFTTMGSVKSFATVKLIEILGTFDKEVRLSAQVTDKGNDKTLERGFCWNTTGNPTIASPNKTIGDSDTRLEMDRYYAYISGLNAKTKYYFRAYATNSVGTSYSAQFETETDNAPSVASKVSLIRISAIASKSAIAECSVNETGATERGVCISASKSIPTTSDTKVVSGSGMGDFNAALSLTENTNYYARAYAIFAGVTLYSNDILNFKSLKNATKPTIVEPKYTKNNAETELNASFNVSSDGGESPRNYVYFDTVLPTSSSVPLSAIEKSSGLGIKTHTFDIKALAGTYYLAFYSTNSGGLFMSSIFTVIIANKVAATTLVNATKISKTKVQLSANVTNFGGSITDTYSLNLLKNDVQFANYDSDFNTTTGTFGKTVELEADKNYKLVFTYRTVYMAANSIAAVVKNVEFDTSTDVVAEFIKVDLSKTSQDKNVVVLNTIFTGAQSGDYIVNLIGEVGSVPYLASSSNTLFSSKLSDFPSSKSISLTKAGIWNLVVLVTGANARVFNSFAVIVEVSSNDDPTTNPNIDPAGNEVFAPYVFGNYEDRPYLFDNKKWKYKTKDNAWQRDYTYTENMVQRMSRVQEYTANAPALAAIDIDKQLQAINDELGAITVRVNEIEDTYLETKSLSDVIELVAMQSTAPEDKHANDYYYNTASKKIYFARVSAGVGVLWTYNGNDMSAIYNYNGLSYVFYGEDLVPIKMYAATAYKVYLAKITQVGTAAPTVVVLENTIGDIVWARTDVGEYTATLSGAFSENTILIQDRNVFFTTITVGLVFLSLSRVSDSVLALTSISASEIMLDDALDNTIIEIRVY